MIDPEISDDPADYPCEHRGDYCCSVRCRACSSITGRPRQVAVYLCKVAEFCTIHSEGVSVNHKKARPCSSCDERLTDV